MDGWLETLLTDPHVLGTLNWAGLVITLIGFAIAYGQLVKTKKAADAAKDAAVELKNTVQNREKLLELNTAIAFLESARNSLIQKKLESAAIYLDLTSASLVQAIELMGDDPATRKQAKQCSMIVKRLAEQLMATDGFESETIEFTRYAIDARNVTERLRVHAARLRYDYDNRDNK